MAAPYMTATGPAQRKFMVTDATLSIRVNGAHRRVRQGMSVADLALELGLEPARVAVERNLEIVPRSAWAATPLAEGDRLEIVHFIGGG
jgi:thiazole synthase